MNRGCLVFSFVLPTPQNTHTHTQKKRQAQAKKKVEAVRTNQRTSLKRPSCEQQHHQGPAGGASVCTSAAASRAKKKRDLAAQTLKRQAKARSKIVALKEEVHITATEMQQQHQ